MAGRADGRTWESRGRDTASIFPTIPAWAMVWAIWAGTGYWGGWPHAGDPPPSCDLTTFTCAVSDKEPGSPYLGMTKRTGRRVSRINATGIHEVAVHWAEGCYKNAYRTCCLLMVQRNPSSANKKGDKIEVRWVSSAGKSPTRVSVRKDPRDWMRWCGYRSRSYGPSHPECVWGMAGWRYRNCTPHASTFCGRRQGGLNGSGKSPNPQFSMRDGRDRR